MLYCSVLSTFLRFLLIYQQYHCSFIAFGLVNHSKNNYFYNMDSIDFGYSNVKIFWVFILAKYIYIYIYILQKTQTAVSDWFGSKCSLGALESVSPWVGSRCTILVGSPYLWSAGNHNICLRPHNGSLWTLTTIYHNLQRI